MHISLAAEPLFTFWGINVTNSLLASFIVSILLITIAFFISRNIKGKPTRVGAIVEEIFIYILDLAESVGGKDAKLFVPLVLTFFFYILLSNWIGLLPGFGSVTVNHVIEGHSESVPLLRGATADLNTTLALALISVSAIQYYGFSKKRFSYLKRFFDFSSPIKFFTGILEFVTEFAKIISFSFRLFGNVFAGEVLLAVIAGLIPVLAPFPFFGLEIFVGFIQALVFAMLTLVFIQVAVQEEHEEVSNKMDIIGEGVSHNGI